jgi:hypothetical protein
MPCRLIGLAVGACLIALVLVGAALAASSEVTRASYKESVEPICKLNTQANERIFKGVKAEVRANKLKLAAAQFAKAARALKQTLTQLKAVPQPSADRAKLAKWLAFVKVEASLFERAAAKLRAEDKIEAERMVVKLTGNADRANNVVIGFEFEYCRFEPSRFT